MFNLTALFPYVNWLAWNKSEFTTNGEMYNNLEPNTHWRDCTTPRNFLLFHIWVEIQNREGSIGKKC